ncbi:MFS transporter [Neisseria leonii]|uniref:MFS transporter n=1 Tax=Neisseria leonii TaxID=2995413 RepID=A0A9X4E2M4_9NEIS|nr:MFS transporter [Neisseria sp. 51.81]MDD9327570.1 MFS transporter [Neisseria sp. 51.81]
MTHASTVPHPKRLLFALALGGFSIGTTEFAAMGLVPQIAADLAISEPQAGHLISAYALGVVAGAPAIAVLGARLSRRTLLLWLMAAFSLSHLAAAVAESYPALLIWRFVSGLPHGAFFGVGATVAASLVPPARRAQAVGLMMTGLTVACIVGVPAVAWLGQSAGWRSCFLIVSVLAAATAAAVAVFQPKNHMQGGDMSPLRELGALANRQVWLTLFTGAIGFGGLFAVYTYIAPTLTEVTRVSEAAVPPVLALFGVGMTLGNIVVPRFAGGSRLMPCIAALLVWSALSLAFFPWAAQSLWAVCLIVVLIGIGASIGTLMQVRLMDVAPTAQTMAGALNNSAFNVANALGPFLGGLAIQAGYGWTSTGTVGCLLALGGLAIWYVSYRSDPALHRPTDKPAV